MNLTDLTALTAGGVTLHNVLRYLGTVASAKVTRVATDVEAGNVTDLKHQAAGVVDFVETHVPAVAKTVDELKSEADAKINAAKTSAADTLRKLAADIEAHTPSA